MKCSARAIAFYLPQFHQTSENDTWWGPGFTEWTLVRAARPLFRGHRQPVQPLLGYYDLSDASVRAEQAELAARHGVEGFCYYHYWFGGTRLLRKPLDEVLATGEPRLPFCLGWANHSWFMKWNSFGGRWASGFRGMSARFSRLLIEQTYPGDDDHREHFRFLLSAFNDDRYITVDRKPLFYIYDPGAIPEVLRATDLWRTLAAQAGLPGLFLVGQAPPSSCSQFGLDAVCRSHHFREFGRIARTKMSTRIAFEQRWTRLLTRRPIIARAADLFEGLIDVNLTGNECPVVLTGWDNTPRASFYGMVAHRLTPEIFGRHVGGAMATLAARPAASRIMFLKSWNEWSEGNALEPEAFHGDVFLRTLRDTLSCGFDS